MTTTQPLGRPSFQIPYGTKVDWNQPNGVIAKQFKVSPLTIMKLRRRLGKKPLPQGRPVEHDLNPAKVKLKIKNLEKSLEELKSVLS